MLTLVVNFNCGQFPAEISQVRVPRVGREMETETKYIEYAAMTMSSDRHRPNSRDTSDASDRLVVRKRRSAAENHFDNFNSQAENSFRFCRGEKKINDRAEL